ncbi:GNAT family N-acetyltransferase [uncultured Polaribacter sp.]|uniref:GNAT family N-acetyltransferase n=1 Tax=uncultured Polaribacter sp. TaxID=174711 RepID=UPI002615C4D9|nr:GNAT family N-acetyltransferase [uncultured Polaribacter sp.]
MKKLQNPVWQSLKESHQHFLIDYQGVKFYDPEICIFGAFENENDTSNALDEYAKLADRFFLVCEHKTPTYNSETILLEKKIDGYQMVLENNVSIAITEEIVQLTNKHIDEVYDLIWLVMPGFYQKRGFEMGTYYGIFKNNKLVAITGQRMQTDHFIEISGVVTHPDYTRKGYAKQLVSYVTSEILKEKKLPILHTNKGNTAITLYQNLGFKITRDMNWWLFKKK